MIFGKKKAAPGPIRFELPVIAQSEVDFSLIRELAFLEGALTSQPTETRVIGTQEWEGRAQAVYGSVPFIPAALTISIRPPFQPDVFIRLRARAEERGVKAVWGAPVQVFTVGHYGEEKRPL